MMCEDYGTDGPKRMVFLLSWISTEKWSGQPVGCLKAKKKKRLEYNAGLIYMPLVTHFLLKDLWKSTLQIWIRDIATLFCPSLYLAVLKECIRRGDQKLLLANPDYIKPMIKCTELVSRYVQNNTFTSY